MKSKEEEEEIMIVIENMEEKKSKKNVQKINNKNMKYEQILKKIFL